MKNFSLNLLNINFVVLFLSCNVYSVEMPGKMFVETIDKLAGFNQKSDPQLVILPGYIESHPNQPCSIAITSQNSDEVGFTNERGLSIHLIPSLSPAIELKGSGYSISYGASQRPSDNYVHFGSISVDTYFDSTEKRLLSTQYDVTANVRVEEHSLFIHQLVWDGDYEKPETLELFSDKRLRIYFNQSTIAKVVAADAILKSEFACVAGLAPNKASNSGSVKPEKNSEIFAKPKVSKTQNEELDKRIETIKARNDGSLLGRNIKSPLSDMALTNLLNEGLRKWFGTEDIFTTQLESEESWNLDFVNKALDRRNFDAPMSPYFNDEYTVHFISGGNKYSCKMFDFYLIKKISISNCNVARRFVWAGGQRVNELDSIFPSKIQSISQLEVSGLQKFLDRWSQEYPRFLLVNIDTSDTWVVDYSHLRILN